ncbi:MAG: hypothetical protein HRT88_11725 [Lentisphaeraceae bacterium]|nr:hypothetical protein [Lentisphaeraceae bacterium]
MPLTLGKYLNDANRYFLGDLDELYIFERALTPQEIYLCRDNKFIETKLEN